MNATKEILKSAPGFKYDRSRRFGRRAELRHFRWERLQPCAPPSFEGGARALKEQKALSPIFPLASKRARPRLFLRLAGTMSARRVYRSIGQSNLVSEARL